jgi:hypothetical protein
VDKNQESYQRHADDHARSCMMHHGTFVGKAAGVHCVQEPPQVRFGGAPMVWNERSIEHVMHGHSFVKKHLITLTCDDPPPAQSAIRLYFTCTPISFVIAARKSFAQVCSKRCLPITRDARQCSPLYILSSEKRRKSPKLWR